MKYVPVNILAVLLLLTACNTEMAEVKPVGSEIVFHSGIVVTRAVIDSDENDIPQQAMNDIQVIRGTDGAVRQGFASAAIASSASIVARSNVMELATPQYFNDFVNDAHFVAFYPKADVYVAGKASWTIDGTQDIMATAPVTAPYAKNGATVGFGFTHRLAQVRLKVIAADQASADAYGKLLSATVKVPSELELTIADDGNASLGKKAGSALATLDFGEMNLDTTGVTSQQGLLVYPDMTDLTRITLTFEKMNTATYPITNLTLTPGYRTLITATVNRLAVHFDVITLQPWSAKTETEGNSDEIGLGDPGEPIK